MWKSMIFRLKGNMIWRPSIIDFIRGKLIQNKLNDRFKLSQSIHLYKYYRNILIKNINCFINVLKSIENKILKSINLTHYLWATLSCWSIWLKSWSILLIYWSLWLQICFKVSIYFLLFNLLLVWEIYRCLSIN